MATIGSLAVNINANTRGLMRGLKRGEKAVTGFQKRLGQVTRRLFRFDTLLTGIAAGGMALFVKRQFEAVDALAKTSDRLGVATENLAGLHHAAELSGVATQQLDMGLQRMIRRVAEAAQGTGEARDAIAELGIDARELARLAPEDQFKRVADALNRVTTQSDRVRLAFKLFDSEGVRLLQITQRGSEGIQQMIDDAKDLGKAVDREMAAKIEEANDAVTRMRASFEGFATTLAVDLAPAITKVVDQLTNLISLLNGADARRAGGGPQSARTKAGFFGAMVAGAEGLQATIVGMAARITGGVASISEAAEKRLRGELSDSTIDLRNFANSLERQAVAIQRSAGGFRLARPTDRRPSEAETAQRTADEARRLREILSPGIGRQIDLMDLLGVQGINARQGLQTFLEQLRGFGRFGSFLGQNIRGRRPTPGTPASNAALEAGSREAFIAQRAGRREQFLREISRDQKREVTLAEAANNLLREISSGIQGAAAAVVSIPPS